MGMTTAQAQAFRTAMLANTALDTFRANLDAASIAAYYNAPSASPVVSVWRPSITIAELNNAIVWSEYLIADLAHQNAYAAMIAGGAVDATKPNIQAGFGTIFAGSVSLTNLQVLAKRVATRFEALFAVSSVTPLFGYTVSVSDVGVALGA